MTTSAHTARPPAQTRPLFPVGRMYALVVFIYVAYPLIGYLAIGGDYEPSNDNRLWAIQPSLSTVLRLTGWGAAHLVAFIVTYALLAGRRGVRPPPTAPRSTGAGIIAAYGALMVFFLALGRFYDLSASDYTESYLVPSRLPLFLAQLYVHLSGLRLTLKLALVLWLFIHYRKYRLWLWTWLAVESLLTVARLGSRTEMVLLLLAALMLYHAYVRRLPRALILAAGLVGFVGFTVLGALRSGVRLEETENLFAHASECESIFANAVDLEQRIAGGEVSPLPVAFYLQDLFALVPQQILPVQKMDAGRWYVDTYYRTYADNGGAFAFGTIPLALLGGGLPDVVLRGIAVGAVFAGIHRWCGRRTLRFWPALFYLWLVVLCYQSFRSTTFHLVVLFEYRILPAILLVTVLSRAMGALLPGRGPAPDTAFVPNGTPACP